MSYGQNYIYTKSSPTSGNICHTGGNLGIGTTSPQTLLHLRVDHNISSEYPTIRLQNIFPKSLLENYWDIRNEGNLYFDFSGDNNPANTKMMIDSSGRLILGTTTTEQSSILQIESTEMGILIPRMNALQKRFIPNPATGLLVYDTENQTFSYFDGSDWQLITTQNDLSDYLTISDFNSEISNYVTNSHLNDTLSYYLLTNNFSDSLSNYLSINEFNSRAASQIDSNDIENWNEAFSWGNHAEAGYLTKADIQTVWIHEKNSTYLKNLNDNVGIGTNNPEKSLHIYAYSKEKPIKSTIRLQNYTIIDTTPGPGQEPKPENFAWDIENNNTSLIFSYGHNDGKAPVLQMQPTIVFDKNGQIGIGTTEPQKQIHIKSADNKPAIRFEGQASDGSENDSTGGGSWKGTNVFVPAYWDIQQDGRDLNFNFTLDDGNASNILTVQNGSNVTIPPTPNKLIVNGEVHATKFIGDGSGLTNLSVENIWQKNGNNIFYNNGNVGIGTDEPATPLYIKSDDPDITLEFTPNSNYSMAEIRFQEDTKNYSRIFWNKNTKNIIFETTGGVGIGTRQIPSDYKFAVNGAILCKEVKVVENLSGADFVFEPDYKLMSVDSLSEYIETNKHLPDVPSANEMQNEGLDLADMNILLLQKIEELTLYIIELNKRNEELNKRLEKLEKENNSLKNK